MSLLLIETWQIVVYVLLGIFLVSFVVVLALVPTKTWFVA